EPHHGVLRAVHARLLQQRGPGGCEASPGRLLLRRADRVRRAARGMARRRHVAGSRYEEVARMRRAYIAGVGETRYARWGQIGEVTEHALACEAIQHAVADAGLEVDHVDGLASFADDRNEAVFLAAELGLPALRFGNMVWLPGGGGGCAAVGNAAMAVETGQAEVVVVYRSLCQGQFFRFGTGGLDASAPVEPQRLTVNHASSLMLAAMGYAM